VVFPGHTLRPGEHRLNIDETGTIPVLFQNPPTALNRIVFAVVGRKVQQLEGLINAVYPSDEAIKKLGSHAATFGTIIDFELNGWQRLPSRGRQVFPPMFQHIDNEITGFVRPAKFDIGSIWVLRSYANMVSNRLPNKALSRLL